MRLVTLIVLSLVFGCMPASLIPYAEKSYDPGRPLYAPVGSTMIWWEIGSKKRDGVKVDGMRKELVYGGTDHGTIFISYREYYIAQIGAMARPSYDQNLRYDVKPGTVITFQDARIRIDSATQERIEFTIVSEPLEARSVQPSDSTRVLYRDSHGNEVGEKK